jgi:hypothetical protein
MGANENVNENHPSAADSQGAAGHPLLIGWQAAKANLVPGLIVQTLLAALVLAYYFWTPAREALGVLATAKAAWGYGFSLLSGVVAGAVLPELLIIAVFQRGGVRWQNARNLVFASCFWGCSTMVVDGFYRLQAVMFGTGIDWVTLLKKVVVDQFLYTPFWATPIGMAVFEWRNQRYRLAGLSRVASVPFYMERTVPTLIAGWVVWIPMVTLVYALPSLLQIPVCSLALTFWVMLFTWMNGRQQRH